MATTPETSTKPESAGTLFQALRNAGVEPDLAYRADDEVRNRAGQNVISVIGAKMDAKTKELGTRMDAQTTALETRIDKQGALLHADTPEWMQDGAGWSSLAPEWMLTQPPWKPGSTNRGWNSRQTSRSLAPEWMLRRQQ